MIDKKKSADLITYLRSEAKEAEIIGRLTDSQLAVIYREKWFNMFVSPQYGGLGVNLIDGLKLEETLAWVDGSLGWTVTLCAGANMFVGYLAPTLAASLFKEEKVCLGGSGKANGLAKIVSGGYLVSGEWSYATGTPHNTAFTANCVLEEAGRILRDVNGEPIVKSFLFLKEEVAVINDWDMMGLIATASHKFKVHNLLLPEDRCFVIDPHHAYIDQPIYRYPFLPFAETTLAVNTLGMACRFFELCDVLFEKKASAGRQSPEGEALLSQAKTASIALKTAFYTAVETSWMALAEGNGQKEPWEAVSRESREMVRVLRQSVFDLYPHCGMEAAGYHTEINRVWRNIFTASQHSLLL